jgi:drug/metabolite transporter (DMT)-like permease
MTGCAGHYRRWRGVRIPVLTSVAMRYVEAVHASVIVGVLPLATAAVGALLHRQRPSLGFWLCAAVGSALVVGFAMLRAGPNTGSGLALADGLLLCAMLCAAVGYGYGARLSQHMQPEHVICWALVIALPLTLPLAAGPATSHPEHQRLAAFLLPGGVLHVAGLFCWYRGLALGTVRVSQVQLVQPFLSMLFAVPLLGEHLDAVTVGFGLAVIATVFAGKKMPVR